MEITSLNLNLDAQSTWHNMLGLVEREALEALMREGAPDLVDKAVSLAGSLFEMVGEENGKEKALQILISGKAEEKMRQIIEAQGGNPEVSPEDLVVGDRRLDIEAKQGGRVLWINNRFIAHVARVAGAPSDKRAGLLLKVKLGEEVTEGDTLFRIYSENNRKLNQAEDLARELEPIGVGSRIGEKMLITEITKGAKREAVKYILDR